MSGKTRSEASSSRKTSDNNGGGESKVSDYGRNRSSCGYCRSPGPTSVTHGLLAHSLTVNDYQDLLDRGWRRSGSFLYKPEMEKTCCPSYTIRLQASAFVPSKEQLRVTRRLQRFLEGYLDNKPLKLKEASNVSKESHSSANAEVSSPGVKECLSSKKTEDKILVNLSDMIDNVVCKCFENGEFPCDVRLPKASVKKVSQGKRKLFIEGSEALLYSSNIAFQIAAAIKKQVKPVTDDVHQPGLAKTIVDEKDASPKAIAEKLTSSLKQMAETIGLPAKACNGHINFYSVLNKTFLDVSAENATISEVSADRQISEACSSQSASKQSPVKRRRLEIHLKRSSFDPEEYALYKHYQIKVHNDAPDDTSVSEKSYKRFLVDSPLIFVPPTRDLTVPPCGFGSFHQQYVIDGKLVAVGVIDILPRCLSSKYLFWDPDYAFISLGKYSALQEVNWVKENQVHCPSLQYYYLGYYIHSCSKMRYKATYRPSELLCPLRYQWVQFDIAKPSLDRQQYVILSDCALLQDGESLVPPNALQHEELGLEHCNGVHMEPNEEENSDEESDQTEIGDLTNMLIEMRGRKLKYKDLPRLLLPAQRSYLESMFRRYLQVVGQELGEKMVYLLG